MKTYQKNKKFMFLLKTTFWLNLLILPEIAIRIFFSFVKQKIFIKKNLRPTIKESLGSLNSECVYKITGYYGLYVPVLFCEPLALIRGKGLSNSERIAATYLGALTSLGDDFFDKKNLSNDELNHILDHLLGKCTCKSIGFQEQLLENFYKTILDNIKNRDEFLLKTLDVYKAQHLSLKQKNSTLAFDNALAISLVKGGESYLLCRSILDNPIGHGEKELIYNLGGLLQMMNDIFDVYKDFSAEIKTLATESRDIADLRSRFKAQLKTIETLVELTSYKKQSIALFKRYVTLCISPTFVCLDQLEELQKKNKNLFKPEFFSRKELICDMEKTSNIAKSLWYYLTIQHFHQ